MRLKFSVEVELERESGKFASRDELTTAIIDWLDGADEGSVDGVGADGESVYTVAEWMVEDVTP